MPPTLSNTNTLLSNSDGSSEQPDNQPQPTLSNITNILTNTSTTKTPSTPTTPTVIEHKVWREENTVYSKIVYADGSEDVKTLDLSDYYNEAYNKGYEDGENSVDITYMGDIDIRYGLYAGIYKYGYKVELSNGKSKIHYIDLGKLADYFDLRAYPVHSDDGYVHFHIAVVDERTPFKSGDVTLPIWWIFSEEKIINAYNEIMAKKHSCFKIRQNETEYSFLVESRQYQPQPNLAYQPAVDGTPVYEILGKEQKTWSFTLYVDTIPKMQFLQQLASNPVCEVYFDEIGEWKQALVQNVTLTRITTSHYSANIELVIL